MITAKEAKELYDSSGKEIDECLQHEVEPKIIKAATAGKREVTIHLGSLDSFTYLDQIITPLQKSVLKKLTDLGYYTKIETYGDSYVPRGLADDNGDGPNHINYGFIVSW